MKSLFTAMQWMSSAVEIDPIVAFVDSEKTFQKKQTSRNNFSSAWIEEIISVKVQYELEDVRLIGQA